jgi:hypothetical protein
VVDVVPEQHQQAVVDRVAVDVKAAVVVLVHLDKALLAEVELCQVQAAGVAERLMQDKMLHLDQLLVKAATVILIL